MILTLSWDDGHPADARLAELLAKHNLSATFYVPCRNREGRPVIGASELWALSKGFEVGGHTLDHVRLPKLELAEAQRQVREGKSELEQRIGKRLVGFCYPGGAHNAAVRNIVKASGFEYARCISNLNISCEASNYELPTSLQFYPHSVDVLLRNYIRYGHWRQRTQPLLTAMTSSRLSERVRRLSELCLRHGHYFHLWGHSWEIERDNLWCELELSFQHLNSSFGSALKVDNAGAIKALAAVN